MFTQERGDEEAGKLAARFAAIVREVIETRAWYDGEYAYHHVLAQTS